MLILHARKRKARREGDYKRIALELDKYIRDNFLSDEGETLYCAMPMPTTIAAPMPTPMAASMAKPVDMVLPEPELRGRKSAMRVNSAAVFNIAEPPDYLADNAVDDGLVACGAIDDEEFAERIEAVDEGVAEFDELHENKLSERMKHLSDTYSEYLMYLIKERNMENSDVYKRAVVDKKIFSKIKNNINYHPNKLTALCLCIGAKLNLDETKDLLARAGYALSPCDKTDIIFSYFIENEIYDMIELDIQLEEHGLPCIIV